MRFVRAIAGTLLLTIALPALFAGGALGIAGRHRDPGGAFRATVETVTVPGNALAVPDLGELLRRERMLATPGRVAVRLTAQTPAGPAFLGLAPTAEVDRYLTAVRYSTVDRIAMTRGPLPVRLRDRPAVPAPSGPVATPPAPADQPFWVRQGLGALQWSTDDLRGRPLSLVVMLPDARPGMTVDLRAELRPGWLDPLSWGLLVLGAALTLLAFGLAVRPVFRPVRPREVVFVVEPAQVPVLAGRLGLISLTDLGGTPQDGLGRTPPQDLGRAPQDDLGRAPLEDLGRTPVVDPVRTVADVEPASGGETPLPAQAGSASATSAARPPVALRLAWPALRPHQEARPVSHPPVAASPGGPERDPGRRRGGFRSTGKHLRDRA